MTAAPRLALLLFALPLIGACRLPLVAEVGPSNHRVLEGRDDVTITSCTTEDDLKLGGFFVPCVEARGLILHLLPRRVSSTGGVDGFGGFIETMEVLRDLGYASLVFDYRGVGASEGEIDSHALDLDARAMWKAALEQVDGHPERIILRAASLGNLAAASLLDDGVRPGAMILAAPIDAKTIKRNAVDARVGSFLGFFVSPFYESVDTLELAESQKLWPEKALVFLAEEDEFFPSQECEALCAGAPKWAQMVPTGLSHAQLCLRFFCFEFDETGGRLVRELMPAEAAFLESLDLEARKDGRENSAPKPTLSH